MTTSVQQRPSGMETIETGSAGSGATFTAAAGGANGVAVTVTSGCVLLILTVFGRSGAVTMRDVSFFGGSGVRLMRDVSFLGCEPGEGGWGGAGTLTGERGRGSGTLAAGAGGGAGIAGGGRGGTARGGAGGTIGYLGAEAGAGGGGTIRRGGTTDCVGGGGTGLRAMGGALAGRLTTCGRGAGGGASSFSISSGSAGKFICAVSRLAVGAEAGPRGGSVMRTVSFLGSLVSAMGQRWEEAILAETCAFVTGQVRR
ncbi:MAG: hypothetical protein ACR2FX_09480 [Chthoniobacterales bacterium]